MNIGASLYNLNTNARSFSPNATTRVNHGSGDQFIDALLSRTSAGKDTFIQSGQDRSYFMYDTKIGNALFQTKGQPHAGEIQDVETERYIITAQRRGELCIYDKMRNENFIWDLSKNQVQVDAKTGSKFLIDDLGSGFFIMAAVDSELENGLKQALGVDKLEEKDLIGFTVHQDRKTGIRYITANGYEGQGGQIIMDKNARTQLDSLAKEYKLHNEQAKEYLQGGEVPSKDQIGELLKKMADTLTEQEKGLVNIFATAQEIDAAKASAELNTTLKEEIFSQLEESGIEIPTSGFEFSIGLNGKAIVTGIEDQATKQAVEKVLDRFADKLSEIYFTTNAAIQQMSKQEQYILKSAKDVERFLQKATGGKITLADITVENGGIKGLPGNLDMLLNNPGQNQTYTDYREEILAIKNYEQIWGSGLLEQFSAGYVISGKNILIK